jgi:lipoprotein-releasing system ATP-binding protein
MAPHSHISATSPAIRVEGLAKIYQSPPNAAGESVEVKVFDDMGFVVERGERLALIGESGAGKSTLLHLLGGLDTATRGKIFYGDTDFTALSPDALAEFRNRHLGFVWQSQSLLPEFTAEENVMFPLLIRGQSQAAARPAAEEMLAQVGLAHRRHHRAGELSGGEQQRVSLARALAAKPQYLLADEPTGNLDENTAAQILELLERLHASYELTSIIVTHSPALAKRCDRTLRLSRGGLYELVVKMEPENHV